MEETTELKKMREEVMEYHNKILKACEGNEELKKIYKGCWIYSTPIYINPNILFFGINPSGKYGTSFEPQGYNPKGYGVFWQEIKNCLEHINKIELLENMVITNRYYFSTSNVGDLDRFFDLLPEPKKDFHWKFAKKQEEWTRTLINELQPKLIIAGGKTIWEKFNKLFPDNTETLDEGNHTRVLKINGIVLIAYERSHNNMADKKEFIQFLEKYTPKIGDI
jgi:hypothetical protein